MAEDDKAAGDAWPLAEYAAMRAEILQCSQQMSTLFNVLIAAVGVVLGVALRPNGTLPGALVVLLVLPVISYLTAVRYVYLYTGAVRIGRFIDTELGRPAPDALRWESWLSENKVVMRADKSMWSLQQGLADWVAFLGTAVIGLVGSWYGIFCGEPASKAPLRGAWFLGVGLTVLIAWTLTAKRRVRARVRIGKPTT